jgi:GTP cyclohydrolase I
MRRQPCGASAYAELLSPRPFQLTTFPNDEGYDDLVMARSIPFHSHLCIALRGVRSFGTRTVTSAGRGVLRDDPSSRQEFFALVR